MKKTIYNVAVLMDSQETCDRMKQLCIDNGLPYSADENAFVIIGMLKYFGFYREYFDTWALSSRTQVTESEFIELLKQEKA